MSLQISQTNLTLTNMQDLQLFQTVVT